jgi:hypothetical protein
MIDPHSTAAGALAGAGISSVTILMGAQVDALILGLISAVFVSIWLDTIDNRIKAAAAVMFSALLAGYGSPVAAAWLTSNSYVASNNDALRLLLALLIGAAAPSLVPIGIKYLGNKINGGQS